MVLPRLMIRKCRKAMFRWKIADSTGQSLTGAQILMRALILRRLLLREVFAPKVDDEKYVGILLPPSNGAVLVNAAVTLCGRVACNLNYTVSPEIMNKCIAKAGIKHVLTSQKVLDKLEMKLDAQVILLEDFKEKLTTADKLTIRRAGLRHAGGAPRPDARLHRMSGDDELTVIFTSGSTGEPKGVVLTHHNVGSNVEAILQAVHLRRDDTVLGIVPFFHSLGFTVTFVDDSGARRALRLPFLAAGSAADRQARQKMGGHDPARDADFPAELHPPLRSGRFRPPGSRRRRRREDAARAIRGV
jgi:acyl-[acyl-carrier-protein]-phospholipid O-acyltransferase/long-chain-fatty-acid--[acyl-carrier-protein] ligase